VAARNAALNIAGGVKVDVFVRVRPRLAEDGDPSVPDVVEVSGKEITLREKTSSAESFAFDRVFGPSVSNEELFDSSIKAVVDQVARGLSSCVFTYGQTGALQSSPLLLPGQGASQAQPLPSVASLNHHPDSY
jgi:hypothetical protein